jgi:hypothetical protein
MDNKQQYLKYKKKYIDLKEQTGGFLGLFKSTGTEEEEKKEEERKILEKKTEIDHLNKLKVILDYLNSLTDKIKKKFKGSGVDIDNIIYNNLFQKTTDIIKTPSERVQGHLNTIRKNIVNTNRIEKRKNIEGFQETNYENDSEYILYKELDSKLQKIRSNYDNLIHSHPDIYKKDIRINDIINERLELYSN